MDLQTIKALTFDVFGTVVNWRNSIIREGEAFGQAKRLDVEWPKFADAWRALYRPTMEQVRSGQVPWTRLDLLRRMSLDWLVQEFHFQGLTEAELDHLTRGVAPARPVARFRDRTHQSEAKVHSGDAVQREHCLDRQYG